MARRRHGVVALASVGALAAGLLLPLQATVPVAQATTFNIHKLNKIQQRLVSSELINVLGAPSNAAGIDNGDGADGAGNTPPSGFGPSAGAGRITNYVPTGAGTCSNNFGGNVKVNQNCLNLTDADLQGRGQANNETSIAQDPFHPNNLVASNNDYRRGDGTCGAAYSTDRGATWNDSTVPNGFTRALDPSFARLYWEAGGDTSVAWDTKGNAYLSCQLFNRGSPTSSNPDQSSGFVVFRSTGNGGASWNFPGRYVTSFFDPTGTAGVLEDKQLIAVDNHVGSPFQDRIYVSWTDFAADGTAYIYESHSSDYGETFSPRVLVSANTGFCTNTFGVATPNGDCNENQYSDPFVGPDGALYVAYSNFNNQPTSGSDNRYEVLLAKSTDGGASFSAPVKVSDYYDLPDCNTYQGAGADSFRSCVPEKGTLTRSVFRATNYASGGVNPTKANQVVVTLGSYINADSNESNGCIPAGFAANGDPIYTGVKTVGACNNKIVISTSNDGGATFTGGSADPRTETVVNQAPGQQRTDQWFQWAAFAPNGTLAVSYYDRQYDSNELSGYSDFSLSGSRDLVNFAQTRVSTSSMPPPTEFYGAKGGQFWGDYTGLTAAAGVAYPIWSDTRPVDLFLCPGTSTGPGNPPKVCTGAEPNGLTANDEDIYTAPVGIPVR